MAKLKSFSAMRIGPFAAACLILVIQASVSRALKIDEQKIGTPGLHNLPCAVRVLEGSGGRVHRSRSGGLSQAG